MADLVDRRILGVLRPVDAVTGAAVAHGLKITGTGIDLYRTRSGNYSILEAAGLEAHIAAFEEPPPAPPVESLPFTLSVEDPTKAYMPREIAIALPRSWDPDNGVRDLMEPIELPLAASAARALAPSWAVVLAIVTDTAGDPVRGALVEVSETGGGQRLSWGITHERGEARVPVPGLPAFREIENDPLTDTDNEIVTNLTNVEVRATAHEDRDWPVNPAVLEAGGAGLRTAVIPSLAISPGRTDAAPITLNMT